MRKFDEESPITACFQNKTCPLIKIDADAKPSYYNSKSQKRNALLEKKDTDKFLFVWPGQWSTDVFELTEKDIYDAIIDCL